MRAPKPAPGDQRRRIASTSASRSARRWRIAARLPKSWRYYERGNALKRSESRYRPEILETNTAKQIAGLHAAISSSAAPAGAPSGPTRSSSSACRGRARRCSSRSSPRIPQVEGTQELADIQRIVLELQGREPDLGQSALSGGAGRHDAGGFPPAGRKISGRHAGLPHGQAVLHRQDAEQFPAYRPDPPDAAQCADHRRPARADVLLLQQPEAAVRQRAGIHLQRRGHRPLLPHLSRADAALGRGAARPGPARAARRRGRRSGRQRAAHARLLRPGVRAGLRRFPQDRAQRAHAQLRAGAPADLPRRPGPVEEVRALA